jgi:sugar lactone lactonase YvrE
MKNKYFISLILVSMIISGCASPAVTEGSAQMAEDPSQKEEAVDESDNTSQSVQSAPIETDITIDGDPSDWEGFQVLQSDPEGDHQNGNFDIAAVRAFSNDKFLYVLIETHQPPAEYAQVDLNASAGGKDYILSFRPQASSTAFMGDVTGGQFKPIGELAGSNSMAAEAVEIKMPLSAFEDTSNLKLGVRAMDGACCEFPDWYPIDEIEQVSVPQIDEKEPFTEIPNVPQVCGDYIASPAPFGSLEPALISLAEDGYSAEWFVAPGEFNMPQDVIITPDGDILVISVRSGELLRVLDDGKVEQAAANIWSYLGVVDDQGNIYLYSHPRGSIKKVTPDGVVSTIIESPDLFSCFDSPIAIGPDGNLYVVVNRDSEKANLFQVTPSGVMTKLAEEPDFGALLTDLDGRFLAATSDTIGFLSLDDYSFTPINSVPDGNISPGGMAIDDKGNIYVSTGSRSHGGKLWRLPLDGLQVNAELIAEIPENGLSGIEWLPDTNEVIGGQLRAGGLIAVGQDGSLREIVSGNGLVSPSGAAFSPCGELTVANDDGEMMTIVDQAGEVEWFFDYVSFGPPIPFMAFTPEGTLYATEGAPGYEGKIIRKYLGQMKEQFVMAEFPSGIVYDISTDTIIISETGAGRITRVSEDFRAVITQPYFPILISIFVSWPATTLIFSSEYS